MLALRATLMCDVNVTRRERGSYDVVIYLAGGSRERLGEGLSWVNAAGIDAVMRVLSLSRTTRVSSFRNAIPKLKRKRSCRTVSRDWGWIPRLEQTSNQAKSTRKRISNIPRAWE